MIPARQALLLMVVLGGSLLFIGGCATTATGPFVWADPAYQLAWPPPPDQARLRYLRTITGPADFRRDDRSQKLFNWLFGEGEEDLPLLAPFAVATDDADTVWVADSGSRMLYRIVLSTGDIEYIQEVDRLRLTSPSGLALDVAQGRVYLADAALDHVFVLDTKGRLLGRLSPPGGFKRPAGLAVDRHGQVYVADVLAGTVAIFDAKGSFLSHRGSLMDPGGKFNRPLNVAIGPDGELLVVDSMNFRVEVQSAQGGLIGTIGRPGDAPGTFARPKGVAVDGNGHVFVADAAFDNIQVFDLTGRLLMHFGNAGAGPGQFNLPAGLFSDRGGRLFVADGYNHRVQVFEILASAK
jgi:DNA-binding beta-propeller fold protein YncE